LGGVSTAKIADMMADEARDCGENHDRELKKKILVPYLPRSADITLGREIETCKSGGGGRAISGS
jgi:hypothetical protein